MNGPEAPMGAGLFLQAIFVTEGRTVVFDWFIVAAFGWPAVFLSLCLTVAAFVFGRWSLLLSAAIVACPFGLYLTASPNFRVIGPVALLAFFLSSLLLRRRHVLVALMLTIPFYAIAGWLLIRVLLQGR